MSFDTWKDARALSRPLVKLTLTHSPADTWRTSGSGFLEPALTAAASAVGTKIARWPALTVVDGRSTALTANECSGAPGGQGLPGSATTGGRFPVGSGGGGRAAGAGRSGSGLRSGEAPGSTRMMPHAPWRNRRPRPFMYR